MNAAGNPTLWYVIGAIVVVAIVIGVVAAMRANRSKSLERKFGPEYDRAIRTHGDKAKAERELAAREERVKRFHIEELPPGARTRYTEEWRTVQTRFVDEPKGALVEADRLVANVMRDRGYPLDDFTTRAADLSPDHPHVVEDFRTAHAIVERSAQQDLPTEDLRQAMVHYRAVFDDLVGTDERKA